MPSGVFKPYAGVSTAILFFTKTGVGGTENVWFYDMQADGLSLDDKRSDLLPSEKQGATPEEPLTAEDHAKNNLPDILKRWAEREGKELKRERTEQSFCVSKTDIAEANYDLSLNRYKQVKHKEIEYAAPKDILKELRDIEKDIAKGMKQLEEMLG
jgi:type I restriction enzyme M protein